MKKNYSNPRLLTFFQILKKKFCSGKLLVVNIYENDIDKAIRFGKIT